jgi:hypothetical protein
VPLSIGRAREELVLRGAILADGAVYFAGRTEDRSRLVNLRVFGRAHFSRPRREVAPGRERIPSKDIFNLYVALVRSKSSKLMAYVAPATSPTVSKAKPPALVAMDMIAG